MLRIVDEKKPVEMFRTYAMKYHTKIAQQEEDFFLNHEFVEEINSNIDHNFSVDLLLKLKKCWKTLNANNKEVIWKYLNILYKINDKILF
jgi:hypothetical protein